MFHLYSKALCYNNLMQYTWCISIDLYVENNKHLASLIIDMDIPVRLIFNKRSLSGIQPYTMFHLYTSFTRSFFHVHVYLRLHCVLHVHFNLQFQHADLFTHG